jgi:hypothetical protein
MLTLSRAIVYAQSAGTCAGMSTGQLANLNGFVPFQGTGSLWNADISNAPVDPNSAKIINFIGASTQVHADFGAGLWNRSSIGIPYEIVAGTQPRVPIRVGQYRDQSDPGPMPVPHGALIQGYPEPGDRDRHVLLLDKDNCFLFELYYSYPQPEGGWTADSTAIWDMTIDEKRPYSWTSADAGGLPIFAGLTRYDEVAAGAIHHALRFTAPGTQAAFVAPASHWTSSDTNPDAPPMGTRLRLKASFDVSQFSPVNRVILTALQTYGIILADEGKAIYINGAPDSRWDNGDLAKLRKLTASDFEVVQMGAIYTSKNLPSGALPVIASFSSDPPRLKRGHSTTLKWKVSDSEYNIISPTLGVVRGNGIRVRPHATTTYRLYSTNSYGRATATSTVTVH